MRPISDSRLTSGFVRHPIRYGVVAVILGTALTTFALWTSIGSKTSSPPASSQQNQLDLQPRQPLDASGFGTIMPTVVSWNPKASPREIGESWDRLAELAIAQLDHQLGQREDNVLDTVTSLSSKATYLMYDGKAEQAYDILTQAQLKAQSFPLVAKQWQANLIFLRGVAALRRGENENCIMCRGESSCILPINKAAVHQSPEGSRLAIKHFTEYLELFPDDFEVRWLLNLAHMTLGEHPHKVDPKHLIPLDRYQNSEVDIGKFRDIGHIVGVNRLNQAGGVIMDDFDNDGLLDLVVTSFDPRQAMCFYRNNGQGTFEEQTQQAGLTEQFGGLTCVQTDYNNDGLLDIYITRGAWVRWPMLPTLLRNNGNCSFTDVTKESGLLDPVNSNAAMWADFDNDGWLDLFVCCERTSHRLYRNLADGTFQNVAFEAGIAVDGQKFGKGCTWFDYDNDGWLDIYANCFQRTLGDVVKGVIGEPHGLKTNKLYRNLNGEGFQDVTREAGLDGVYAAMGCNYGDFDNDGFLDMYLGTGDPNVATLIPNRMFKNLAGKRFVEVTGSAGVGHLQKGHAVACGEWDRDGNTDIFAEMGGAIPGDQYHNVLFQNPGHDRRWITVKLVGKQTNRAALGVRIKVVTAGSQPLTIYRHVSPGSSFGSSPLEQTIGLAKADRIALLEIHWPTSRTTQVFRDVPVDRALEITEFADEYRVLERQPVVWRK